MTSLLDGCQWMKPGETFRPFAALAIDYEFAGRAVPRHVDQFLHVHQVHSSEIVFAQDIESSKQPPEADGIICQTGGTVIAVKTADCIPLLCVDRNAQVVAAVHAGWRGLTSGIIRNTLNILEKRVGVSGRDLLCAIGPAISSHYFEVGPDVFEALKKEELGLNVRQRERCLMKGVGDRWHIDLQTACAYGLLNLGVPENSIGIVRSCTFAHLNLWNSYRRDGKSAGRNWSWISLQ